MAKKYYWLKMDNGYLSSPKVKKLRKIAGGDTYTIIYLKMLLLSIENGGLIEYQGIEPTLEEELALILDEDEDNVKITVAYLLSQGLLVFVNDKTFFLPDAAERIGTESESKERVRAYRERKAIRDSIPLEMVKKLTHEQILLPDGNVKFIDNKRYGGNAEYVYELAECKCEICGESNTKKLLIHHNNGYSNDLEDLYLLCHSCHKQVENGTLKCDKHKRKAVTCNSLVTACNIDIEKDIEIDIEKDIDIEKEKDNKRSAQNKHFVPPTVDEVRAYCKERGNNIDAESFVDYYTSTGWLVGKKPMKDWKASVRTWERNERRQGNARPDTAATGNTKREWHLECAVDGTKDCNREPATGQFDWSGLS